MYKSCLIRRPFFYYNFIPTAARSKKMSKTWLTRSPKKGCTSRGFLISHGFFWAPYQLMKRFSPQNGRFGPNFWKTFEDPSQKHLGSLSAIRVPQKEQLSNILAKTAWFHRKQAFQKFAKSLRKLMPPIPQKERPFSRYDAKNALFRRKKAFQHLFKT